MSLGPTDTEDYRGQALAIFGLIAIDAQDIREARAGHAIVCRAANLLRTDKSAILRYACSCLACSAKMVVWFERRGEFAHYLREMVPGSPAPPALPPNASPKEADIEAWAAWVEQLQAAFDARLKLGA